MSKLVSPAAEVPKIRPERRFRIRAKGVIPRRFLALLACISLSGASTSLHAQDWTAPDGTVYPDFTQVGIPGGIPDVAVRVKASDHGTRPDDNSDDAPGLQRAVNAAESAGGGAVLLEAGTYHLEGSVVIDGNGVVLRGAGQGKTIIVVENTDQQGEPDDDDFSFAFVFKGKKPSNPNKRDLNRAAARGDTVVYVDDQDALPVGALIEIATTRLPNDLNGLVGSNYKGFYLYNVARVLEHTSGGGIRLDRPLRGDFTSDTNPEARHQSVPIERCGIEELTIEQRNGAENSGIEFYKTENCWMRNVEVLNIGNWPVNIAFSDRFEVRGSRFEGTRRTGGGEGYFGVNFSTGGLIANSTFHKLRHFTLQQSSTGNVVTNCNFDDVDINFHLNWPSENLIENSRIVDDTDRQYGSYGWAFYTPPWDSPHLPAGPRLVFYNNEAISEYDGVFCGGGTASDLMVMYNKFTVRRGAGVFLKKGCRNGLYSHNRFCLQNPEEYKESFGRYYEGGKYHGGIVFASAPVEGNRFVGNEFYMPNGFNMFVGVAQPATNQNNSKHALQNCNTLAPPEPPAESLLEWQGGPSSGGAPPIGGTGGTSSTTGGSDNGTGGSEPAPLTCTDGLVKCAGRCVDTNEDVSNCGACGASCASGQDCVQGSCECYGALSLCGGSCVNPQESAEHCGQCGNVCGSSEVCNLGSCATTCTAGLEQCGRSCVDTSSSSEHCGSCGNTCENAFANTISECRAGTCEPVRCLGGFVDADKAIANGCELACTPTGAETCNGADDDCDGSIDEDLPGCSPAARSDTDDDAGCACSAPGRVNSAWWGLLLGVPLAMAARRRRLLQ